MGLGILDFSPKGSYCNITLRTAFGLTWSNLGSSLPVIFLYITAYTNKLEYIVRVQCIVVFLGQ